MQHPYQPQPHPVSPGFVTTVPPQQQIVTQTVVAGSQPAAESGARSAIPDLPFFVALILLIVNIFFPGVGTILAGISVLFCGSVRESGGAKLSVFCINFWIGILQILLAPIIIGWIWSVIWGIAFVSYSGSTSPSPQQAPASTVIVTNNSSSSHPHMLPQPNYGAMPAYHYPPPPVPPTQPPQASFPHTQSPQAPAPPPQGPKPPPYNVEPTPQQAWS